MAKIFSTLHIQICMHAITWEKEIYYAILLKYLPSESNPAAFFQHILSYILVRKIFFC